MQILLVALMNCQYRSDFKWKGRFDSEAGIWDSHAAQTTINVIDFFNFISSCKNQKHGPNSLWIQTCSHRQQQSLDLDVSQPHSQACIKMCCCIAFIVHCWLTLKSHHSLKFSLILKIQTKVFAGLITFLVRNIRLIENMRGILILCFSSLKPQLPRLCKITVSATSI